MALYINKSYQTINDCLKLLYYFLTKCGQTKNTPKSLSNQTKQKEKNKDIFLYNKNLKQKHSLVMTTITKLKKIEGDFYNWSAKNGIVLLRISIGIVFFWFGAQKFFPGVSSAEDLATRTIEVMTFGFLAPRLSVFLLALWETIIGIGFLTGKFMRATIALLFLQMIGTFTPLFFFPAETFFVVPIVPTLEGQYIIKNIVIISAAMVIAAYYAGKTIKKQGK